MCFTHANSNSSGGPLTGGTNVGQFPGGPLTGGQNPGQLPTPTPTPSPPMPWHTGGLPPPPAHIPQPTPTPAPPSPWHTGAPQPPHTPAPPATPAGPPSPWHGGGGSGTPATPTTAIPMTPAEQVKDLEAKRQAAVRAGNANIDSAFAHFNDPFYKGIEDAYKGYYNPQVDSQYADADGTMEAGFARNGTDRSSIAATKHGQLFGAYADQRALIGSQAHDAAIHGRTQVDAEKNNLYALNAASADPAQASARALAAQTALVQQPAYSPLGAMFANFIQPFTAYANSANNNAGPGYKSPISAGAGAVGAGG